MSYSDEIFQRKYAGSFPGSSENGGGGGDFSTNFPATENPISQGSIWQLGSSDGLDWQNMQTTASGTSRAFGTGFTGASGGGSEFDDNLSHLKTSYRAFNSDQYAQGTTYRAIGYTPTTNHETELLLRFSITAHTARGYELLWSHDGWLIIVRWNGNLADFTELSSTGGPISGDGADNDIIKFTAIGTTLKAYKNSIEILSYNTVSDSPRWDTGQPGIGAWIRGNGSTVTSSFCWKNFTAGNL